MNTFVKLDKLQKKMSKLGLQALSQNNKALLHMATGSGKTVTAMKIYRELEEKSPGLRMLWLTHKNDLVNQSAFEIINYLGFDTTLYNGEIKDASGQVVVASIPSISKNAALNKFERDDFDLIVIDEAHHSVANSWMKVLNHFSGMKLALTATPYRPDQRTILNIFGKPVASVRFKDAQKLGVLAKVKAKVILTNSTIEGMVKLNVDYTASQLEKLYSSDERNKIIVQSYIEHGRNEVIAAGMTAKAICFCINTKHARRMSKLFKATGVKAEFVSSNIKYQSPEARENIFNKFKDTNEIEVLCSVNILNEGSDIPDANIGLMARPTRSNIIYSQQIGRLARINNGLKQFFVVLDFVDQTRRKYSPYLVGNLIETAYQSNQVVTQYIQGNDELVLNERVLDITKSVDDFEDELNYDLLKDIEALKKEALYFKEFGYHSKEFINASKKPTSTFKN